MKIFHDITEDCSILFNRHAIKCEGVFDTQVAHRLIYEHQVKTKNEKELISDNNDSKKQANINISLNGLLKYYLNIDNVIKDEIGLLMENDIYFWLKVINCY